jgi:hypothetical protein
MVMVLDAQVALNPAGKPLPAETPAFVIPVAPVVACVIFIKAVLMHKVGVVDAAPTVLTSITVIVPVALPPPQPPVNGILYGKVPETVGVPLMVMVLEAQLALNPAGKPLTPDTPGFEIPVAPVVLCVMLIKAVLMHKVGVVDAALAEFAVITVIVPVAFTVPQPPSNEML